MFGNKHPLASYDFRYHPGPRVLTRSQVNLIHEYIGYEVMQKSSSCLTIIPMVSLCCVFFSGLTIYLYFYLYPRIIYWIYRYRYIMGYSRYGITIIPNINQLQLADSGGFTSGRLRSTRHRWGLGAQDPWGFGGLNGKNLPTMGYDGHRNMQWGINRYNYIYIYKMITYIIIYIYIYLYS